MPKLKTLTLLAIHAVLLSTSIAYADDTVCRFAGNIELDGASVTGGTRITAVIEGDEYHTHTPIEYGHSTYYLTIQPPEGKHYSDGTEIIFEIDGYTAEQTGTFKSGTVVWLDLTASTSNQAAALQAQESPSLPASSSQAWPIIGLVIGLLLATILVYYVVVLRRVLRKGFPGRNRQP